MTSAVHSKPAILLVHGAWHGAWCWEKLVPELTALGWRVATVDLPSASADPDNTAGMYDDALAVRACLDGIEGPVTVLAHSYGGLPATEAAVGVPKVSRLVYLSAFQLEEGDSLAGQSGGQLPSGDSGTLPAPDDPYTYFYADAAQEDADRAAERLVLQTVKSVSEPLTAAAWKTVASSYIVCEKDAVLPPVLQEAMAARADRSYRLPSSHSPFLSMPAELARLITADAHR
ncbi:alpha/beta fold hydrolase [Streptomyces sp. NBC_00996]|uniref:alpha/beta fold hydrolase n=1 Tax=Streptomyces sp. NBC_00996 TaxID=2903710 RepID=UPI00386C8ABD|nr:alpha/beta fold hydrolase [Streptomyces sp. NBC_00996]